MPSGAPPGMTSLPRRGHTLWEMVVVLVLLGTIAALVAPAVRSLRRSRDDEVSRTVEAFSDLLAQARRTALERGQAMEVIVDPASARAWIISRDRGELRQLGVTSLTLDPRTRLSAQTARVRFTFAATGLATGGPVTVLGARAAREITVDPWSGEVHVSAR